MPLDRSGEWQFDGLRPSATFSVVLHADADAVFVHDPPSPTWAPSAHRIFFVIREVQDHFRRIIHKGLTDNGGIMKSAMKSEAC